MQKFNFSVDLMYINFKFRSNFLNIQAQSSDPFATRSDLLVLMLSKRDKKVKISPLTKKIDKVLGGLIASLISNADINGDEGEMSLIYTPNLSEKNFYPKKIMILVFGDVNDKTSKVSRLKEDDRMYHLLESVGTKPNVIYQTKVRNTDET